MLLTPQNALPAAAALPGDMRAALPAMAPMLIDGAFKLLIAFLILLAGWTLGRWCRGWLTRALRHTHVLDDTLKPLLANIAFYAVLALTLMAVLGQFGIQTTSLIAVLGGGVLAIGLALQGTLSNVASGVMLLGLRPFRAHDKVDIGGTVGTVQEVGFFRTVMVSDNGVTISIPNATVFGATIQNFSTEAARRTAFTVDIDHGDDIAAAQQAILAMLKQDGRVLQQPAPSVEVDSLSGTATVLSVQAWLDNKDFGGVLSDLRRQTRQALQAAGVRPPVPLTPEAAPIKADRQASGG